MDEEKLKNLLIVGLLIIVLLLGGLLIHVIKEKNDVKEPDVEEKNNNVVTQGQEITDMDVVETLKSNVEAISIVPDGTPFITNLYKKTITTSDLSENDKLAIAMYEAPSEEKVGDYDTKIIKSNFDETYYKIFGKTNITYKDIENTCPIATYDKKEGVYNLSHACGGGSPYTYLKYNYKYTTEGNKYYVYQSVGIINFETSKIEKDVNGTFYKDYEDGFTINESNYQDFSSYKWTFEKENEYYVFKSIEEIK